MAGVRICAILAAGVLGAVGGTAGAEGPVALREVGRPGRTTRAKVELKAEGLYRPAAAEKDKEAKSLALRVETRFGFAERVLTAEPEGPARRVARRVIQAASAINGEVRPIASQVRPEVSLLVAERREGRVVAFSPGGPLTRSELELVEGAGDPLCLAALLPEKPVAVGQKWTVGDEAARSLSGYDALALNRLEATLESCDDETARVGLNGQVRGAALGGEGAIKFAGWLVFDRKAGLVTRLEANRGEARKPGPVEAGLEMKSTLTVDRREVDPPPELGDEALAGVPTQPAPHLELLLFSPPDGKYTLLHDRDWHTFWDDARQTVLKRLDHGEVVAQCNLAAGPDAGKGRHQDLGQFRDDLRQALGRRFDRIVGAGEVDGAPAGGFRYRVEAQGHEGDVELRWYYYLIASPEGDQLLATFTLAQAQAKRFGDQDLRMIGSLEWKGEAPSARAR
jgi:hypothetical protein